MFLVLWWGFLGFSWDSGVPLGFWGLEALLWVWAHLEG